jgi:thiol-disulfide isomerase/thioredoxin
VEASVVTFAARRALAPAILASVLGVAGCALQPATVFAPERVDVAALQKRLESARGTPLLLVFWATWCKPCVEEIPDLVALQQQSGDHLHILAVSLDSFLSGGDRAPAVVQEFLKKTPVPYAQLVYVGTQDALFDTFDLPGSIPYALLYDAQGHVLQRFDGPLPQGAVAKALGFSGQS